MASAASSPKHEPTSPPQILSLNVQLMGTGQRFGIQISRAGTVSDLKEVLDDQNGVGSSYRLYYMGAELDDDARPLASLPLHDGAVLQIMNRPVHSNPLPSDDHGPFPSTPPLSLPAFPPDNPAFASYAYGPPFGLGAAAPFLQPPYGAAGPLGLPAAEPVFPVVGVRELVLSEEHYARAMRIYALSRWVKIFAIIDVVFMFLWSLWTWWFVFGAILAIAGYVGAIHYRTELLALYVFYQLIAVIARVLWMVEESNQGPGFYAVASIGIAVQFFIAWLVLKLIREIKAFDHENGILSNLRPAYGFWGGMELQGPVAALSPARFVEASPRSMAQGSPLPGTPAPGFAQASSERVAERESALPRREAAHPGFHLGDGI